MWRVWGRGVAYIGFWWVDLRERDHLDDIGTDGINYLLTPCSRVLLQKLTGFQRVKKFPAFHGTGRFIIAFKTDRNLSLS